MGSRPLLLISRSSGLCRVRGRTTTTWCVRSDRLLRTTRAFFDRTLVRYQTYKVSSSSGNYQVYSFKSDPKLSIARADPGVAPYAFPPSPPAPYALPHLASVIPRTLPSLGCLDCSSFSLSFADLLSMDRSLGPNAPPPLLCPLPQPTSSNLHLSFSVRSLSLLSIAWKIHACVLQLLLSHVSRSGCDATGRPRDSDLSSSRALLPLDF